MQMMAAITDLAVLTGMFAKARELTRRLDLESRVLHLLGTSHGGELQHCRAHRDAGAACPY
jgi:hypothetical protein